MDRWNHGRTRRIVFFIEVAASFLGSSVAHSFEIWGPLVILSSLLSVHVVQFDLTTSIYPGP